MKTNDNNHIYIDLNGQLKQRRLDLELTEAEAAEKVGISVRMLKNCEKPYTDIPLITFIYFLKAYKCTVDDELYEEKGQTRLRFDIVPLA